MPRFRSPKFYIRIKTPQEIPVHKKEKISHHYESLVRDFCQAQESHIQNNFSTWKESLRSNRDFRKILVGVCNLFYKALSGRAGVGRISEETKKELGAALSYALEPEDIIPDYVPEFGYLDDVYCINLCLVKLKRSCPLLWEQVETFLERHQS